MNDNYIFNECCDIFNSLETLDCLKFAKELLFLVTDEIRTNIETEKDQKNYKKLENAIILIKQVVKENEVNYE